MSITVSLIVHCSLPLSRPLFIVSAQRTTDWNKIAQTLLLLSLHCITDRSFSLSCHMQFITARSCCVFTYYVTDVEQCFKWSSLIVSHSLGQASIEINRKSTTFFLWTARDIQLEGVMTGCVFTDVREATSLSCTCSGGGDSSMVRAPDSWLKGCGFESLQERRENFLLQGRLSVMTLISVSVPPPCYRSST